jgi:hypothetical protein
MIFLSANASDGNPRHSHPLAAGGHAQMISAMRHRGRPAQHDSILCAEGILDHNVDVGKGTANALYKWHELCWPAKRAAILTLPNPDTTQTFAQGVAQH